MTIAIEQTRSDLNLVIVINGDAWIAEVMARAVLLKGLVGALGGLAGTGSQGLSVNHRGRIQTTAGFQAFLGETAVSVAITGKAGPVTWDLVTLTQSTFRSQVAAKVTN